MNQPPAPSSEIDRCIEFSLAFAATARWIGNEADLSVTFDEPSK